MNSYIVLDNGISLLINMQPYSVDRSHPNFDNIIEAVKADNWDAIPDLIDIAKSVQTFGEGKIEVDAERGVVRYEGQEMDPTLVERLLRMMTEGFSIDPLLNFIKNLFENTSSRAIMELYTFLDYGKMPITPDGFFLAYKRVRADYRSVHDGKTDNSIGKIVEMPRNQVDDRSDNTCSHGLHFCSHGYLSNFSGERVVILKVNPADVVSIPTDYNNTKGRACRYEVIGELSPAEVEKALSNGFFKSTVLADWDDADRDFDDDEDNLEDDMRDQEVNGILEMAREDRLDEEVDDDLKLQRLSDDDVDEVDPSYGHWLSNEPDAEEVSQSYFDGYERGRTDGRAGVELGSPVVVSIYVANHDDYVEGYNRGHADGRGHKARADLVVAIPTDNQPF
jgi:hypothetical protein